MYLMIDNYDSFVHNLARYFEVQGVKTCTIRNDEMSVHEIQAMNPEAIVISPGPCAPKDAGICLELIKAMAETTPILGVCLGHQCIGEVFGGKTQQSVNPLHGLSTKITHNRQGLFKNVPSPVKVAHYHSLITHTPDESVMDITARSEKDEIMAMAHKTFPVYGVQFHPESVLTECGLEMVQNFIDLVYIWHNENGSKDIRSLA